METRSKKPYYIDRCAGKLGPRLPREEPDWE